MYRDGYSCVYNQDFNKKERQKMVTIDYLQGYTVYKISDTMCRYVHCVYADIKVKLGVTVFKAAMKTREQGLYKGFMKVCEIYKNDYKEKAREGTLFKSLSDFRAKHLPDESSVKTWTV